MTINRIGMGFGLLKTKMEGSLSVGRMDSFISPRPESMNIVSFMKTSIDMAVVHLQRDLRNKSNHPGDS